MTVKVLLYAVAAVVALTAMMYAIGRWKVRLSTGVKMSALDVLAWAAGAAAAFFFIVGFLKEHLG